MNKQAPKVILTQMTPKERRQEWSPTQKHTTKRLLRNTAFFAAASLCLGMYAWFAAGQPQKAEAVMSQLTAGFEYDETLGRLQFVSNILPESAMVFLSQDQSIPEVLMPTQEDIVHTWTQNEPWIEYTSSGDLSACMAGEVVTVVANRQGEHTIRIIHDNGYESIYSGLNTVTVNEFDAVSAGQSLGISREKAAFELRKDGISILPVFSQI